MNIFGGGIKFVSTLKAFFEMEKFQPRTQKVIRDNSAVWADQETLDCVFAFIGERGLDYDFTEVSP